FLRLRTSISHSNKYNYQHLNAYFYFFNFARGLLNDFSSCRIYVDSCEVLAIKANRRDLLITTNELNAKLKAKDNNMKGAYDDLQKSIVIKDSIYNIENTKQISELMTKYETEKKDKEITENKLQMQEKNLELEKKSNANRMLIVGVGGLVLLIVFGSISFIQRQKLQNRKKEIEKQKALEQTRASIARDLHDDIGSTLSSINILSGMAGAKLDSEKEKVRDIISRISTESKRTHESMYDIIWEVKPENDSLDKAIARMREYASEILEAKNIRLHFPRNENLKVIDVEPVKRHALYLIFKEAVNNIAKYSGATEARINLVMEKNSLLLSIEDNGNGFSEATVVYGNGIRNMKQRSELVNAAFALRSSPGSGTSVTLNIPIP
ncbi:MAG TPA: sensor histidine kinase, partial [Bacteroidia bacterium]|nr:sensor histidine kinase [Bacteroidia bacterium]